jgi:hypothetical protein
VSFGIAEKKNPIGILSGISLCGIGTKAGKKKKDYRSRQKKKATKPGKKKKATEAGGEKRFS